MARIPISESLPSKILLPRMSGRTKQVKSSQVKTICTVGKGKLICITGGPPQTRTPSAAGSPSDSAALVLTQKYCSLPRGLIANQLWLSSVIDRSSLEKFYVCSAGRT